MDNILKVKSISIWIFIIPFVAVNTCLILITEFHSLFPDQEDIIWNTFPYLDGGTSISRTARPYPSWLIFKPAMFLTSYLLIKYWLYNRSIVQAINGDHKNIKYLHDLISLRENTPQDERINGHSHIRSLFFNSSELIPFEDNKLKLGEWKKVFFVELDPVREREIYVISL